MFGRLVSTITSAEAGLGEGVNGDTGRTVWTDGLLRDMNDTAADTACMAADGSMGTTSITKDSHFAQRLRYEPLFRP
jgi:hypothetical protein